MGFAPQPGRSHALSERRNAVFFRKMPGVGSGDPAVFQRCQSRRISILLLAAAFTHATQKGPGPATVCGTISIHVSGHETLALGVPFDPVGTDSRDDGTTLQKPDRRHDGAEWTAGRRDP